MRTRTFDPAEIRAAFTAAPGRTRAAKTRAVCGEFDCSPGTVARALNDRKTSSSPAGPAKLGGDRAAHVLPVGHPATLEKRTIFPTMVLDVDQEWLLKGGENSGKIGGEIRKGAWKGFRVYTLTLEERSTCPTSCRHWSSCYGNSTPYARRWRHGAALEWRLTREVAALELKHPGGFAIRLHNLGDFYSVGYVRLAREGEASLRAGAERTPNQIVAARACGRAHVSPREGEPGRWDDRRVPRTEEDDPMRSGRSAIGRVLLSGAEAPVQRDRHAVAAMRAAELRRLSAEPLFFERDHGQSHLASAVDAQQTTYGIERQRHRRFPLSVSSGENRKAAALGRCVRQRTLRGLDSRNPRYFTPDECRERHRTYPGGDRLGLAGRRAGAGKGAAA